MVTVAQKDVLLEFAGGAIALTKDCEDNEAVEADVRAMGRLRNEILYAEYEELDFDEMVAKIKPMRAKYENS